MSKNQSDYSNLTGGIREINAPRAAGSGGQPEPHDSPGSQIGSVHLEAYDVRCKSVRSSLRNVEFTRPCITVSILTRTPPATLREASCQSFIPTIGASAALIRAACWSLIRLFSLFAKRGSTTPDAMYCQRYAARTPAAIAPVSPALNERSQLLAKYSASTCACA
jgi:hypothetical protein